MRFKCLVDGELSQGRKDDFSSCGIFSASHCCHELTPMVQKM